MKAENKPVVIWKGPIGRRFEVAILATDGHFHGLKKITRFFKLRNFCVDCEISYNDEARHRMRCKARCYGCSRVKNGPCPQIPGVNIICGACLREYKNQACYEYHLRATCKFYKKCPKCQKVYVVQKKKEHECGESVCQQCHSTHKPERGCFMKPLSDAKNAKPYRICVYDLETSQVICFTF